MAVESSAASLMERVNGNGSQPVLAVDIPIGLPELTAPRECDREARAALEHRWMCVFSPPDRELLGCKSYAEVQELVASRKERNPEAKGLARQGYNIGAKIKEFDDLLAGERSYPSWLIEVHPEVSFRILAGKNLTSKKRSPGKSARRKLLEQAFPNSGVIGAIDGLNYRKKEVAEDDRLDACIALWSANRFAQGDAEILGSDQFDASGFPMRIVA